MVIPGFPIELPLPLEECNLQDLAKYRAEQTINHQAAIVGINICVPKCVFSRTCSKKGQRVLDCEVVKKNTPTIVIPVNQPIKLCCGDPSCHHEIAPTKCRSCGAQCPCQIWEVACKKQTVVI